MHEDLDQAFHDHDDEHRSKAEWRRANSRRASASEKATRIHALACAHRRGRFHTVGGHSVHLHGAGGPRRSRSHTEGAVIKKASCGSGCGKAQWHEILPDWFRYTLNEQLEVARAALCYDCHEEDCLGTCTGAQGEVAGVHSDLELADTPLIDTPVSGDQLDQLTAERHRAESLEPVRLFFDDSREEAPVVGVPMLQREAHAGAPDLRSPVAETCDVAVQCFPEEMLVPMYKMRIHQRTAVRKLGCAPELDGQASLSERYEDAAPLAQDQPYTIASHFSMYEDAAVIVPQALALEPEELQALAGHFLGAAPRSPEDARRAIWIAGVEVQRRHVRQPRKVPERHVVEAALLRAQAPQFGARLLAGARGLLLEGMAEQPLVGRSLLTLALWDPPQWARLAHTALDFTARLILAGALPRAFASEILAGLARLPQTEEASKMLLLGIVTVLPAAGCIPGHGHGHPHHGHPHLQHRRSEVWSHPLLVRSESSRSSVTPGRTPSSSSGLFKTYSAPADLGPRRRSTGTILRPHEHDDSHCPPCQVTFGTGGGLLAPCCGRGSGVPHEIIPSAIELRDLPAYWREAVGGSLSPAELEKRAAEAEEELRTLEERDEESEESEGSGDASPSIQRTTSCTMSMSDPHDTPRLLAGERGEDAGG